MNTKTKRGIATGTSLALIGGIVVGAFTLTSTMASTDDPAPRPASSVTEVREPINPITPEDEAITEQARETARIEAERVAAEKAAAEAAAKAEAERRAAEQAAADEAARQAAQQSSNSGTSGGGSAPSGPTRCPSGQVPGMVDDAGNESMCYEGDYTGGVVVP